MKKLFYLVLAAGMLPGIANAQIQYTTDAAHGCDHSGGMEIDINNDGVLDLVYGGRANNDQGRVVYDADENEVVLAFDAWKRVWNASTNSYDVAPFDQIYGIKPFLIPADFNGDGNIDYFAASESNVDGYANLGLFLNDGNGKFVKQEITVTDVEGTAIDWRPRAIDIADFNCDGLPDIVGIGWSNLPEQNRKDNCAVLINKGNFNFTAYCTDLMGNGDHNFEFALCTVRAVDLNNDGYADFMVQGNVDNPQEHGIGLARTFVCYLNLGAETDPEEVVAFYDLGLADGVSHNYGNGNFACADFNNDGVMDIFVGGESPDDARPAGAWEYFWQMLIGKVSSDGSVSYTDKNLPTIGGKDIRPLGVSNVGIRAIDYYGNGQYDLVLDGWCTTMLDGTNNTQSGWIFKNDGTAALSQYERVPGASEVGVFFLENGVQGARNYAYAGGVWDGTYFNDDANPMGRNFVYTVNPNTKAARPDAPTSLAASVDGSAVTLSWAAAASSAKNVTYEYYIKNKNTGKFYNSCASFVGGDKDGVRKAMTMGNAYMNKTLTLTLPDGNYTWGVQTINAGYEGSTFAEGGSFTIGEGGVAGNLANGNISITANGGVLTVAAEAGKAEVFAANGALVEKVAVRGNANVALPAGIYVVKVTTENGVKVQKVVL